MATPTVKTQTQRKLDRARRAAGPAVGDVRRFDYQSDVFEREFRLVEDLGNGLWKVELLPIRDETLDAMMTDPYTTDDMIERDIAATGRVMEMKFISAAAWDRMF